MVVWARTTGPVRTAFLASLLLSYIAVQGHLVNRDGIYYLETAQAILEDGIGMALRNGGWNFLPLLIATLSAATTLGPETAAHGLNALLMAGTCALAVDLVRRRAPEAAWMACLVVLAMPAYNQYRNEILREYGFWFFCMLGFWLAMRQKTSPRWRDALASQFALAVAALFRLEAVAFYPALMLWQAFSAPGGMKLKRVWMIGLLPMAGVTLAILLFGSGLIEPPHRVLYYLDAANPLGKLGLFREAAERLTTSVLNKYSREEAGYVLFFGLLSIIPMKFLVMSGILVLPLGYQFAGQPLRAVLARWQPLPWALFAYLLVLLAFVTHQFFLVGRYVSLLNLLAVPFAACGLVLLLQRFPRWRMLMIVLVLLTMTANVVSLSPRKTQIVEAGRWLGENVRDASRVGVSNSRIAYYAGWRPASAGLIERDKMAEALASRKLDMVVIESSRKQGGAEKWLEENGLKPLRRFSNKAGDAVIVAGPATAHASPEMTDRIRSKTDSTQ